MPTPPEDIRSFESIVQITDDLRGPKGCPWDKEQTPQSLTRYIIEEAYELVAAIDSGKANDIKDELGDNLFQVLLQSKIFSETQQFDIYDVIQNLSEKMIRRHPHVFANLEVENSDEVLKNWDAIKKEEKKGKEPTKTFLKTEPQLPAWLNAHKIGKQAKKFGFDWDHAQDVLAKVKEELLELEEALKKQSQQQTEEELGDLIFSLSQLSRHLNIDMESCFRKANQKFAGRFESMLQAYPDQIETFAHLPPEQKEKLWNQAKEQVLNKKS